MFYSRDLNSFVLVADKTSVPVSKEKFIEIHHDISRGAQLSCDESGVPVAIFKQPSAVDLCESAKSAVTALRWLHETGGITLPNGVHVATGIDDQNRITSVIANAELAGVEVVDFKAASGWVSISVADLKAVAAAIALHVQQCFSAERAHHEAIDALAAQHAEDEQALQAALQAYDIEQGWPTSDYTNEVNDE